MMDGMRDIHMVLYANSMRLEVRVGNQLPSTFCLEALALAMLLRRHSASEF
jgi:hypothetical protein